jgi:6-phosphogluconolactonase (cycloisomerase 2 family)
VRASFESGGLRRLIGLTLATILALSGCGSGSSGAGSKTYAPGAYAYVTSAGATPGSAGAVYEYAIGSDGSVSPLAQPSIGAGIDPAAVVVVGGGGYVYVVNAGDGSISQYNVASDGTLAAMSPATVTNPGMHTFGVAGAAASLDPTESFLYVANTADNNVAQFSIGSDGQLTALNPGAVATGVGPVSIAASGSNVYVVNSAAPGDAGSVIQYAAAVSGTLTPVNSNPVAAGTNPSVLAIDDVSPAAYVLSNCDGTQCLGSIRQFTIGADGALIDAGTVATTGSHYRGAGMSFHQDGFNDYAYVLTNEMSVDTEGGALWSFQAGASGALIAATPPSLTISGVAVTQIIESGALYVLTTNSGVIANTPATGGSIVAYSLGTGGTVTLQAATKLLAPYPSALGILVLLPP